MSAGICTFFKMRKNIVVCQVIVHQLSKGMQVVGLFGVLPNGEVEQYVGVEDAARQLANEEHVTTALPEERGWEQAQELPPMMRLKFERLLDKARAQPRGARPRKR
jgi:hypothetical protein